jgi:hypothetical protein
LTGGSIMDKSFFETHSMGKTPEDGIRTIDNLLEGPLLIHVAVRKRIGSLIDIP